MYDVRFYMDNKTGGLKTISIFCKEHEKSAICHRLEELLTQKYGKPSYRNDDTDGLFKNRKICWHFPSTTITLAYVEGAFLALQYDRRKKGTLNKL